MILLVKPNRNNALFFIINLTACFNSIIKGIADNNEQISA